MGTFVKLEIDESKCTPDRGAKLAGICPLRIFRLQDGSVAADPENEDECTLCELCLGVYPSGAVTIRRLYREE